MVIGALALLGASANQTPLHSPLTVPWWAFVPAFMLTEALLFHLEIRDEAHSFSLSELPLVIGFFFAAPWAIVLGRVLGELLYLTIVRRQALLKLTFNLAMHMGEVSLAVLVFHLLSNGVTPLDPMSWVAVVVGVVTADLISMTAVTAAIRWHGGQAKLTSVMVTGGLTAAANISLSILAAVILWVSPWAMALFALVAMMVALGYRGYAALSQRYSSLQLLYDFTRMVGAAVRAEAVMDEVLAEARKLLRAARAEVVLVDRATGAAGHRLRNEEQADRANGSAEAPLPGELLTDEGSGLEGQWVWREVVENGRPVVIARTTRDRRKLDYLEKLGVRDCIAAPLRAEDGVVGIIMVSDRLGEVSTFDDEDLQLFATLANHASVAFENGRLVEQLRREADERRHEALHDPLTGLPNRTLFIQRVAEATRPAPAGEEELAAAVMLMDLDRFKEVNDTLGHHNGDLLLREVAVRLTQVLRRRDTVARLGGDEFAVLLPDLGSVDEATQTALRIAEALRRPFTVDELSLDVGVSIGIAIYPEHGDDASTLLQRADVAMYEAKAGRDAVALYSPERDNYSPKRLALAAELRSFVERGELLVYHQPKARLSDGVVTGTEALVRWRHPEHGLLGPDEFIPMAEHSGLISALTTHVLRVALAQCREWNDRGHAIGVSVNLAVRSLLDSELPTDIEALLAQVGLTPDHLTLEITESGVMADPSRTIKVLERLSAIGVKLSVDDFGTGYSSLSYLQRLPVQEVKIDRSFVFRMATDANDATIVQSIIELGHNLGLCTVAEGVEDQMVWDRLRAMGCDEAQGYYLSKPVPASAVTRWLDERKAMAGPALSTPKGRAGGGARNGHERGLEVTVAN
ncbi:MAG TPA: EAL domain-containing protein [Acidimicrobiales bacterium]|nr:EAL domain-containing protein [Acidimicrobiales bacterium]